MADRTFLIVALIAGCALASGCRAGVKPRRKSSMTHVRQTVSDEMVGVVGETRRMMSRTWADIRRDWNYIEEDGFRDMRNAVGQ